MREHNQQQQPAQRPGLYQEVTDKIITQIEAGVLPWVQPWAGGPALSMPVNVTTHRGYSGINILLLWDALFQRGYDRNRWLTFKQALSVGGAVRKGEHGTTVVFADRFTPKGQQEAPSGKDGEARSIPFLKRFTVFNIAQCEGLPADMAAALAPVSHRFPIERAELLIQATGAVFQRGGEQAYYHTGGDYIRVPEQDSFYEPINFYRTALHELTHWTGAKHRLDRDFAKRFGDEAYAREELVAEMGSAFLCASLGIVPTVRHADYIGNWLTILKNDARAIISSASNASKAADFLLAFAAPTAEVEAAEAPASCAA